MSADLIKHISDASFDAEVLKSDKPVLVDFWAEWCGPCKMIAPILAEVSDTYAGKLQVAKVNVDENRETPAKFGIRGIPTLILFKNGQIAATKVGALSKAQLTSFLDGNLYSGSTGVNRPCNPRVLDHPNHRQSEPPNPRPARQHPHPATSRSQPAV